MDLDPIWDSYEDLPVNVYAADMDTYDILYMNRKVRENFHVVDQNQILGKKCFEVLQGNASPCANCTNHYIASGKAYEWEKLNPLVGKMAHLKDQMLVCNGKRIRIEIASEVADKNFDVKNKDQQYMLLIGECLRIALEQENQDNAIQNLMEQIGHILQGERTYIFELNENNMWDNTYEWCASDVIPQIKNLQNLPFEDSAIWIQSFLEGLHVTIPDVERIKELDPVVYDYLKPQNIQSIIVGPIFKNEELYGFYGIDNPKVELTQTMSSSIKKIAHVLEILIQRANRKNS